MGNVFFEAKEKRAFGGVGPCDFPLFFGWNIYEFAMGNTFLLFCHCLDAREADDFLKCKSANLDGKK
jgi:hypothetical protein